MAALLVAIAVMAIMMSVAMPVWRHDEQREKEAELVFRGNQYVRAIRLFQAKTRQLPTSVDMLVQGHFLRKKYLDPITNQEFNYIGAASVGGQPGGGPVQAAPGRLGAAGSDISQASTAGRSGLSTSFSMTASNPTASNVTGSNAMAPNSTTSQNTGSMAMVATASNVPGGLIGVQSKSTDESIMVFNGRDHYNEWVFLYVAQNPGINGGPAVGPVRGGQGGQNGRGRGTFGPGGRGPAGGGFPFQVPDGRGRGGGR